MQHVHVGALSTFITFLEVIICLYVLRFISVRFPNSPIGRAAAALN